jgi:hypothetical protein
MNQEIVIDYESFKKRVSEGSIKYSIKPNVALHLPESYLNKKISPALCICATLFLTTQIIIFPALAIIYRKWDILIGLVLFTGFYAFLFLMGRSLKASRTLSLAVTTLSIGSAIGSVKILGILSPVSLSIIDLVILIFAMHLIAYFKNKSLYQCLYDYKETYEDAVSNNKITVDYKSYL